jgi:hypothetical protein
MMLWIYNVGKMITGDDDGKMKLMALGSIILGTNIDGQGRMDRQCCKG